MTNFQLAQLNIGRLRGPLDSPMMAEFVRLLGEINALADASPGFVWRLQDDTGYSSSIRAFDDPLMAINLTVWESLDALWQYTYYSPHAQAFRRRAEWFEKLGTPYLALWWVPTGHIPSIGEALARLEYLTANGPSPRAFTFKSPFVVEDWLRFEAGTWLPSHLEGS